MGLLIRNGQVITDRDSWVGDVYCQDGTIVALGKGLKEDSGDQVLDATGQLVLPGGVDPHVHLELEVAGEVSSDDFETGTAAALAGGTTTIIDFVHPERGQNPLEALSLRQESAKKAVSDYALHMAVTWWDERWPDWMRQIVEDQGVSSFKVYMAYKDAVGIDDDIILLALEAANRAGGLVLVHAENGEIVEHLRRSFGDQGKLDPQYHAHSRPAQAEGEATARATTLAGAVDAPLYVVHVTCRESLSALSRARQRGQLVYGETCPQYLLLDDRVYTKKGLEALPYVLSPPIRSRDDQQALWAALRAGLLHVVATDHCPFHLQGQKDKGLQDFRLVPNGAGGVEHRLALLFTHGVKKGRLDIHQFVDLVSTRAARTFGLYPRKGTIGLGSDADLLLWDPEATATISHQTHHQRCDTNIFEGFRTVGRPTTVVAGGMIRYQDGELTIERGAGRYLQRLPRKSSRPSG